MYIMLGSIQPTNLLRMLECELVYHDGRSQGRNYSMARAI